MITLGRDSFDKMIVRKGSIELLNGAWCAKPKDQGGIEIQNLEIQNQCLLSK
jgi:hypothetical protein